MENKNNNQNNKFAEDLKKSKHDESKYEKLEKLERKYIFGRAAGIILIAIGFVVDIIAWCIGDNVLNIIGNSILCIGSTVHAIYYLKYGIKVWDIRTDKYYELQYQKAKYYWDGKLNDYQEKKQQLDEIHADLIKKSEDIQEKSAEFRKKDFAFFSKQVIEEMKKDNMKDFSECDKPKKPKKVKKN